MWIALSEVVAIAGSFFRNWTPMENWLHSIRMQMRGEIYPMIRA